MDHVKLYFDPRCAWCYQTSRFLRILEEEGVVDLDYGLYCLEVANMRAGKDAVALGETGRSAPALRTAWTIAQRSGSKAIGPFYRALDERAFEYSPPMTSLSQAVREAAIEAGFDETIVDEAMENPDSWLGVLESHRWLVEDKGAIGVPAVLLDGGDGPVVFGPVISFLPDRKAALELWEHLRFLIRLDAFGELKRERVSIPDMSASNYPWEERTWGGRPWVEEELAEATTAAKG